MARMVNDGNVDVIVGDWLSEMNIAWNAITKSQEPDMGYEAEFLSQLTDCIDMIVEKKIKVITNAGALNTTSLADKVLELCCQRGHDHIVVASVLGDDISDLVTDPAQRATLNLHHLDHPQLLLDDWELQPHCGVAYIGAWGIVEALQNEAQFIICGRVTDASPDSWNKLAGALVAGHLIECGPYVTGANFSGFKEFLPELVNLAFQIAEVGHDATCTITKPPQHAGRVTKFNTIAQLLYELQGELYLNPDVAANLRDTRTEQIGPDRVRVAGVTGSPPPRTTKAMIAAKGGYQAEATFYINGLDVDEKVQMMRQQLAYAFRDSNFSHLSIDQCGQPTQNPFSQQAGTVFLRIFVQARRQEDLTADKFKVPIYAIRMQSYPGYHMNLDFRTMDSKPFMELFPAIVPLDLINHRVVLSTGKTFDVSRSLRSSEFPIKRPSYETAHPADLSTFGPTTLAPLGKIVHARSGDKADNLNIGFFVRHEDEYPWLQSFLTVQKVQELFGEDWTCGSKGKQPLIERCEFPGILAVHFRVLDFLGGGIASSSRIDGLGKVVGEFLRSRVVLLPDRFLERGAI